MKMIILHVIGILIEIYIYSYIIRTIALHKLGYPYYFIFYDAIAFRSLIIPVIMYLIMMVILASTLYEYIDVIILTHLSNIFGLLFSLSIMNVWLTS